MKRFGRRITGFNLAMALMIATTPVVFAADVVPFSYSLAMTTAVRGRDMISNTGDFCNYFHATHVDNINLDPNIWIELRQPPLDGLVGATVSYPTNGGTYVFCWRGFRAGQTYFFKYFKRNNGKEVDGSGNVTDH